MVARYTQIMEGSNPHPAAPFLPGAASPTSLTQTQSVLLTSVTPSNTRTTPPPSIVPRQGLLLATNLDHASSSLNNSSAATEATISPFNTYTVSPVMDPLTLEINMVNEHAKASTAATIAPAPAAEVELEIVTEVVTEAPAGAALPRPLKRRSLPMINQAGTRTIEENIAKAMAQEKESELALATQKAESQKQEVAAAKQKAELQKQEVAAAKQKAELQKQEEEAELQKQEVAAAKQKAELQKQEEKAELAKQEVAAKTKDTTRPKVAAVAKKAKK
jgi:hypothetical protein